MRKYTIMSNKVYIAVIVVVTMIVLIAALFAAGEQVSGGEPHKCSTSTNINDLFCREK